MPRVPAGDFVAADEAEVHDAVLVHGGRGRLTASRAAEEIEGPGLGVHVVPPQGLVPQVVRVHP